MRYRVPWLYGIQSGDFIKIGVALNIRVRMEQFRGGNPHPIKAVLRRQHKEAYRLERYVHAHLKDKAVGREWFRITVAEARAAVKLGLAEVAEFQRQQAEWISKPRVPAVDK